MNEEYKPTPFNHEGCTGKITLKKEGYYVVLFVCNKCSDEIKFCIDENVLFINKKDEEKTK